MDNEIESAPPPPVSSLRSRFEALSKGGAPVANGESKQSNGIKDSIGRMQTNLSGRPMTPTVTLTPSGSSDASLVSLRRVVSNPTSQPASPIYGHHLRSNSKDSVEEGDVPRGTLAISPNANSSYLMSSALRTNKTLPTNVGIGFPPKPTGSTISRSLSGSNLNIEMAHSGEATQQVVTDVENMARKLSRKPPPPPPNKKQPPPPPSRTQVGGSLSSTVSGDPAKSVSATDLDLPSPRRDRSSPSLPPRPSTATDRSPALSMSHTPVDTTTKPPSPQLPPRSREVGSHDTTVIQHSTSGFKTPSKERLVELSPTSPPTLPSRSPIQASVAATAASGPPLPPRLANPSTESRLSAPALPPRSAYIRNESSSEDVTKSTPTRRRVPPPPSSDSRPVSQYSISPSGSYESLTPSLEILSSPKTLPPRNLSTEGGAFLPPPTRTMGASTDMSHSGSSKPRDHHFPHLPHQFNPRPITKIFAAVKFGTGHSNSAATRSTHENVNSNSEPSPVSAGPVAQGTAGLLPPPMRTTGDGATASRPVSSLKRRCSGSSSSDEDEPSPSEGSANAPAKRVIAKFAEDLPDSSRSNRRPPILPDFQHVPDVLAPHHHRTSHIRHHHHKRHCSDDKGAELQVPYQGVVAVAGWWVVVASPGVITITNMDTTSRYRRDHDVADEMGDAGGSRGVWTIELEDLPIEWKTEKPRVTAMEFRHVTGTGNDTADRGRYLWCGTKDGLLLEFDIWNGGRLVDCRAGAHTGNVVGIYRLSGARMLTMDETGKTLVFPGVGSKTEGREGEKWLTRCNPRVHRIGHKEGFARLLNGRLWTSSSHQSSDTNGQATSSSSPSGSLNGKSANWGGSFPSLTNTGQRNLHHHSSRHRHGPVVRVHEVNDDGGIQSHSCAVGFDIGNVTCGTTLASTPGLVYLGHQGGWITIWSDPIFEASRQEKGVSSTRSAVHRQGSVTSIVSTAISTSETASLTDEGSDIDITIDGHAAIDEGKTPICLRKVKVAATTITALEGVGSKLWAGLGSGSIYVYDIPEDPMSHSPPRSPSRSGSLDDEKPIHKPWVVTNVWKAYIDRPIVKLCVDPFSVSQTKKLVVYSVAREGAVKFWDGFLAQNWIDARMVEREQSYCVFRPLRLLVCTWNIDAAKPDSLTGSHNVTFLHNFLTSSHGGGGTPDIIVFGFQEVINLEDKKLTAKTVLLGPSKKKLDGTVSEKVSRHYKLWHDKLVVEVQRAFPTESFVVQHTENLVGLFTCVFVRRTVIYPTQSTTAVSDVAITTVKTGMKGMYGNKGAIVARFTVDDTSLCFLNCHLAAGQKQKLARNLDLASILDEKSVFPSSLDPRGVDNGEYLSYVGGGDGSMILDHELCFLNGDLNYRIDLRRDAVINHVQAGHFDHLLQYDQLLHELKVNPAFRLHTFSEAPIAFAPTYKYDRRSTTYDTSEKRRIPAWCDRILYRSRDPSRVQNLWYGRYETDVSDHRPVCGVFTIMTKKIIASQRDVELEAVEKLWLREESSLIATALAYLHGR